MTAFEIGPFRSEDRNALVRLWHAGWHDAHASLVPKGVLAWRRPTDFRSWFDPAAEDWFVARGTDPLGFVTVCGREVAKLYVGQKARGSGVAAALLAHAQAVIGRSGFAEAELLCLDGNWRAQNFYQREGWRLATIFSESLWVPDGVDARFAAQTRRYVKRLST